MFLLAMLIYWSEYHGKNIRMNEQLPYMSGKLFAGKYRVHGCEMKVFQYQGAGS